MATFLINFVLCSLILYWAYIILLENENIHRFKRVYLLFSLVFSLVITFIPLSVNTPQKIETLKPTTVIFTELKEIQYTVNESVEQTTIAFSDNILSNPRADYRLIPGVVYLLVTAALLFRFLLNILAIARRKRQGVALKQNSGIILIKEKIIPHSFGKYIFVNRDDYESGQITKEIIIHESSHIGQYHFLDIIFVELLIIFFWFNPMLYLYRNKIKLNHEFLADKAVIRKSKNIPYYQTLLINMACRPKSSVITSRLNYLLTKKRFIMMTKTTSKKKVCCRTLALIPVFIVAIGFFTTKTTAQNNVNAPIERVESNNPVLPQNNNNTAFTVSYNEFHEIIESYRQERNGMKLLDLGSFSQDDLTRLKELFLSMSPEQQNTLAYTFERMKAPDKKIPTKEELESWKVPSEYGVWLDGKRVENPELNRYQPSDFSMYYVSRLTSNATNYGKHVYQLNLYTNAYYNDWKARWDADETLYIRPNRNRILDKQ